MLGRSTEVRRRQGGMGYDHLEVVVDDTSRVAVVVPVPDESGRSAALALDVAAAEFARRGIRIERVLTDNGLAYTRAAADAAAIARLGARHKRTRPWRPQTNGKAERFIQTLINEWAYGRAYRTNDERTAALPGSIHFYNARRPHTALGGRSPLDIVNDGCGDHS